MWNWLGSNHDALGVILQFMTLVVWALYFQLFLSSFRDRKRAKILINVGAGRSLDARCLVTNMSAEPVYVEAVVVALSRDERPEDFAFVCSLSSLQLQHAQDQDPRVEWYQGPLRSAECLDVGSFRWIIDKAGACGADRSGERYSADAVRGIRLTVIASYTADSRAIAAERVFDIDARGEAQEKSIEPRKLTTRQITSPWRRRYVERLLQET